MPRPRGYIMAGLLVAGFFCNAAVTAVAERHHRAARRFTRPRAQLSAEKCR